ncbi:MAG: SpoIID/LytB domain-containing protein [Clostridia bacterium]|nr:SpoIID/LytB domain-containing protein [Clostridia bacterium]MBR4539888.1 SpoIID/LytB domain-containing protein [Clostridia bacterium]
MKNRYRFAALALALLLLLPPMLPARAEKNTGVVRVLLTRLNLTNRVELSLDGSYTLNELSFQRGSKVIVAISGGSLMVYYEGMALDAGKQLTLVRHAVADGQENGLRVNGAYELHPGDLVLSIRDGQLRAVLHAPVEEYLLGVVPYEMSDSFPVEALKAQAVAARTYALRKAGANPDYDVVDNTNDQAYYGVKAQHVNAAQAVRETAGLCGFYQGALAECYYSASNGGQTELASHVWGNGDYNYLVMVDDPYDLENPESVVKQAALPKELSGNGDLGKLKEPVLGALSETLESRGYDGDMEHIRVTGIAGAETAVPLYTDSPSKIMTLLRLSLTVQARRLLTEDEEEDISIFTVMTGETPAPTAAPAETGKTREQWSQMETLSQPVLVTLEIFPLVESALDLSINGGRNELITVRETDTAFVLESRRFGHGVGMSQRGAQRMADIYHWTYDQILRFYYPGMQVAAVNYTYAQPTPLARTFLTTPGPAATPTPRPTAQPLTVTPGPGQYRVTVTNIGVNSYLNMRAAPNTQAEVLRQLYYGQQLIVLEEGEQWLNVRTDDLTGYVMKEFVQKE